MKNTISLSSKKDFQDLLMKIVKPIILFYSKGKARVHVGAMAAYCCTCQEGIFKLYGSVQKRMTKLPAIEYPIRSGRSDFETEIIAEYDEALK